MGALSDPQQFTSLAQLSDSADIVGEENIDGVNTVHIKFSYDPKRLGNQAVPSSGGTISTMGPADGDIWVEKSTGYARRLSLKTQQGAIGGQTTSETTILLVYSKFDEAISPPIEKPKQLMTIPGQLPSPTPGAQ